MEIKKQEQEPTLAPTIHAVAKPATKAMAWGMTAAGAAALAFSALRTLREG
jgi:hypothetical protein